MRRKINNILQLKRVLIVLLFLLSYTSFCSAQDFLSDMKKIRGNFKTGDITFTMKYAYYPYDTSIIPSDSMSGRYCMEGDKYYYKITRGAEEFEYLKNENYNMVIDHKRKVIALKPNNTSLSQPWSMEKFDSLVKSPDMHATYSGLKDGEGMYSLSLKKGRWSRIDIIFSTKTYSLIRIEMSSSTAGNIMGQLCNKPKVVIDYSGYKRKIEDKTIFNTQKYFKTNSGSITLTGAFRNYRLMDFTHKQS